jgi:hypothetical protein
VSDPQQLGTVERYFLEIMDIPRLQQRIDCFIFTRQFAPNINRVCDLSLRLCFFVHKTHNVLLVQDLLLITSNYPQSRFMR